MVDDDDDDDYDDVDDSKGTHPHMMHYDLPHFE